MFKSVFFLMLVVSQISHAYEKHENILFKFASSEIDDIDLNIKNEMQVEEVHFWLRGYSDTVGDESYNLTLSQKRAEAAKNFILSKLGLKESQIVVSYYGRDLSPEIQNKYKRRVEIAYGTKSEIEELVNREKLEINNLKASKLDELKADDEIDKNAIKKLSDNKVNGSLEKDVKHTSAAVHESEHLNSGATKSDKSQNGVEEKLSESSQTSLSNTKNGSNYQRYSIGLGVYNNILLAEDKGTGNEAEWISTQNYNFNLSYQFKINKFWVGADLSYHKQDYEVELNPTFIWDEESPSLLKISLVTDYESKNWGISLDLDFHEVPFIYEQGFNVSLLDIFMFGLTAGGKYKWYTRSFFSSRIGIDLVYPVSGSNEINPKGQIGYIGFIDLKRDRVFSDLGFSAKIYYGFKNYTSVQNSQEEEVLGILFSVDSLNWL